MTRLEKIVKLKELEQRKVEFENIKSDVIDYYCKEVSITVQYNSDAYHTRRKYDGDSVDVDKDAFVAYLKLEIEKLESQINMLIARLTNE